MKKTMNFRVTSEDITTSTGEVLTEADYEQMADEAEHAVIDVERLLDRQRRGVGRPALVEGVRLCCKSVLMKRPASNSPSEQRPNTRRLQRSYVTRSRHGFKPRETAFRIIMGVPPTAEFP